MLKKALPLIGLAILASMTYAQTGHFGKHVHDGHLNLDIATDKTLIDVKLEGSTSSLIGFEHAPKSVADKQTAQNAYNTLSRGIILWSPEAKCTLISKEVDLFGNADHKKISSAGTSHAEINVHYTYQCQSIQAMKQVSTTAFKSFGKYLKKLEVNIASEKKQKSLDLTNKNPNFTW